MHADPAAAALSKLHSRPDAFLTKEIVHVHTYQQINLSKSYQEMSSLFKRIAQLVFVAI